MSEPNENCGSCHGMALQVKELEKENQDLKQFLDQCDLGDFYERRENEDERRENEARIKELKSLLMRVTRAGLALTGRSSTLIVEIDRALARKESS